MDFEPFLVLPQLRTFYGVALDHSFTAAAARLGRTPSAVSHAIRTLEEAVGVRLVDRRGRTVRLTEDGERLFATCTAVYAILDDAGDAMRSAATTRRRRLRVGAPPEFGCSVLVGLLAPFLRAHADIHIDFRLTGDLLALLRRDELDIAIDCVEHAGPDLHVVPLFRETYMVVCAPSFGNEAVRATPLGLGAVPVLSMDKDALWWNRLLRVIPARQRPQLKQIIVIDHVRGMIAAACAGMGVALVPSYAVRNELERGAVVPLFPGITLSEDRFRIYQKKSTAGLDRHQRLVEYLQSADPAGFGLDGAPRTRPDRSAGREPRSRRRGDEGPGARRHSQASDR